MIPSALPMTSEAVTRSSAFLVTLDAGVHGDDQPGGGRWGRQRSLISVTFRAFEVSRGDMAAVGKVHVWSCQSHALPGDVLVPFVEREELVLFGMSVRLFINIVAVVADALAGQAGGHARFGARVAFDALHARIVQVDYMIENNGLNDPFASDSKPIDNRDEPNHNDQDHNHERGSLHP